MANAIKVNNAAKNDNKDAIRVKAILVESAGRSAIAVTMAAARRNMRSSDQQRNPSRMQLEQPTKWVNNQSAGPGRSYNGSLVCSPICGSDGIGMAYKMLKYASRLGES